ncbi:deoxyribodipyrimidine photolyase [Limnohabitans sp. TS-CS-82]|uniref:FAD-binding domain-containing protein n=1 Tax=Limnohabitans sp. TS-CS-82 TaxID=2094193 RepID=UPI000CF276D2|nr:FAD-binding domain-containing protein [Limnohabitans sp. TS-CS-82]PQA83669.1 deoxyribodipyrimidine photolyase [Limnohabitans sp. TS-CS-82]
MHAFPPTPQAAQQRLAQVNPRDYAQTRNALDGAVTGLSPYLTHGFLSVPEVALAMYKQHRLGVQHKLLFELGWREYYQHLHAHLGDGIAQSLHEGALPDDAYSLAVPEDVRCACTHVPVIDQAVRTLYATGYLHNHARMWLASYLVHFRKVHWRVAADWLYSHLLDGDLASNYLSWQWIAGTSSSKPYLFNAESLEKFAPPSWHSPGTVLDASYDVIELLAHNRATVAHERRESEPCEEPTVLSQPPEHLGFTAPAHHAVLNKTVWLVHPWHLADLPGDLPDDVVCVAVAWSDLAWAQPWSLARWQFVGERMVSLAPHRWCGPQQEVALALSTAAQVHTVAHLRLPEMPRVNLIQRPAPRLFKPLEKPQDSFFKWWTQVTKNVRHLQQLVLPFTRSGPNEPTQ